MYLNLSPRESLPGAALSLSGRRAQIGFTVKPPDEVVIGNWMDENFLNGRVFDTILADYLIGAIDGFAPYFQVRRCYSLLV